MEGYYFCEDGEHTWGDFPKRITGILYAKGTIKSPDLEGMTAEGASKFHPWGSDFVGRNTRSRAKRLRKLSWMPKMGNVDDVWQKWLTMSLKARGKLLVFEYTTNLTN